MYWIFDISQVIGNVRGLTLGLTGCWHHLTVRNAFENVVLALLEIDNGRGLSYLFESCKKVEVTLVVLSHLGI